MTLLVGVDEAGYGPNLGPLTIGLTAWQVKGEARGQSLETRDSQATIDLYRLLESAVTNAPDGRRIAITDSKTLYKPGGGLAKLERGVLAMLVVCYGNLPTSWDELLATLGTNPDNCGKPLAWHADKFNPIVPVEVSQEELDQAVEVLQTNRDLARLRLMRARLVYPEEFNAACDKHGSKGLALSHWTLQLLTSALLELLPAPSSQPPASILVTCDKHGGRNKYAGLLAEHFPEYSLRVIVESRPRSVYLLTRDRAELRIEFRTKGESRLETALSSMIAKYLRELAIGAFNRYWKSHLPDLKPTAGYPQDAKRFKASISDKQRELDIADSILWRYR